jgi:hypothetical protein
MDPQYRLQLESVYEALENGERNVPFTAFFFEKSLTKHHSWSAIDEYRWFQHLGVHRSICTRL